MTEAEVLEAYFLQALYWSLGSGLMEEGRVKFDTYIKYIAGLTTVDSETELAGPGKILSFFLVFELLNTCTYCYLEIMH